MSSKDGQAYFRCDHSVMGRVWQLSIIWDQSIELPMAQIWRSLLISLVQQVQVRYFTTAADEVEATLQMTLSQGVFRLYGSPCDGEPDESLGEEFCRLYFHELQLSSRERRSRREIALVSDFDLDVIDPSSWTLIPTLQAHGCRISHRTSEVLLRIASDDKKVDVWEQRATGISTSIEKVCVNTSRRILLTLNQLKEVYQQGKSSSQQAVLKITAGRRYRLVNATRHSLWFGQHFTAQTVKLGPSSGEIACVVSPVQSVLFLTR